MRLIAIVITALLIGSAANAQITLTKSNYGMVFGTTENTTYTTEGEEGTSFDIGGNGTNETWDFNAFSYASTTGMSNYIDPSTTPYAAEFSTATHTVLLSAGDYKSYAFFIINNQGMYFDGYASETTAGTTIVNFDPDVPELLFPATVGSNWTYTGNPYTTFETAQMKATNQTRSTYEIDAAGTMQIAAGGHFSALRLRTTTWSTSKTTITGMPPTENMYKSVTYTMLTLDGIQGTILADTLSPLTGSITLEDISYLHNQISSGIEGPSTSQSFKISTAYPNPVATGESATIELNIPKLANASVRVYTVYGVEVTTLFNGMASPGTHSYKLPTSSLAPGNYFVRMSSGANTAVRMLTVVR